MKQGSDACSVAYTPRRVDEAAYMASLLRCAMEARQAPLARVEFEAATHRHKPAEQQRRSEIPWSAPLLHVRHSYANTESLRSPHDTGMPVGSLGKLWKARRSPECHTCAARRALRAIQPAARLFRTPASTTRRVFLALSANAMRHCVELQQPQVAETKAW